MINCFRDLIHAFMTVLLYGHGNDSTEEDDDVVDAKEDEIQTGGDTLTLTLTSSLRKVDSSSKKKKKKVQWVDVMGIKDLAEIREFEPCEDDDIDQRKNCVCVIL
ncbi:uncharacterized protein LOC108841617 isoform X2 [Raphanus sativus]|uniref:Uncharacterized protein LOC108841617 isoform X2 n=1 Tax=Raphanus sativus TaxID=3726 RepID=A0A6J0MBG5_RAPSA|nr:uncharacterized protein LOC108841617 isoform X2 [Raphanus sativus]